MVTPAPRVNSGPLVRIAAARPLATFLTLGLVSAYTLVLFLAAVERQAWPGHDLPEKLGTNMEEAASLVMVLALLATTVWVTWATEGRSGLRQLAARATRWRVHPAWWVVAVLAIPTATVGIAVASGDELHGLSARTLGVEVADIAIAFLLVNLLEEITWAGFLQTRVERRFNFFFAALLTAVPFALVHVPVRVVSGEIDGPGDVIGNLIALLIICLIIRLLIGGVLRGAANSILVVAATHTFFNRSNNTDGIAADLLTGDARSGAALLASVLTMAIVLVAVRQRLGRDERSRLDAHESAAVTT